MNEKTLENFTQEELLSLALAQQQELLALRQELQQTRMQLALRQLVPDEVGSIAQAALQLSGIFETAQQAADQYLTSVDTLRRQQEADYQQRLDEAEQQAQSLLHSTHTQCLTMEEDARAKSAYYWDSLSRKIEEFFRSHPELCQASAGEAEDHTPDEYFGPDD